MAYCKQRDILFIHIPKTGGTSVKEYLFPFFKGYFKGEHYTIDEHSKIITLPDKIITVVRNPYTRLVSKLFYNSKINSYSSKIDVEKEVYNFILFSPNLYNHKIPQNNFIKNYNVKVFKTETLTKDMVDYGFNDFNIESNITNRKKINYMDLLNQRSITLINWYYYEDFKIFGYDMIQTDLDVRVLIHEHLQKSVVLI